mmetsp:Transcript_15035/g.34465  ORF Transcript_15035/g.34465 Transcript_15035/m.34465 type:complete len:281 (-) Transcript_15035:1188-2030(-)
MPSASFDPALAALLVPTRSRGHATSGMGHHSGVNIQLVSKQLPAKAECAAAAKKKHQADGDADHVGGVLLPHLGPQIGPFHLGRSERRRAHDLRAHVARLGWRRCPSGALVASCSLCSRVLEDGLRLPVGCCSWRRRCHWVRRSHVRGRGLRGEPERPERRHAFCLGCSVLGLGPWRDGPRVLRRVRPEKRRRHLCPWQPTEQLELRLLGSVPVAEEQPSRLERRRAQRIVESTEAPLSKVLDGAVLPQLVKAALVVAAKLADDQRATRKRLHKAKVRIP